MNCKATGTTFLQQSKDIRGPLEIQIYSYRCLHLLESTLRIILFSLFPDLCLKYARYFIEMCLPNGKVNDLCLGAWLPDPAL